MKKKDILNLIRCHVENNDIGFRSEAREIAREFDATGDSQLAAYVMSLLSSTDSFVPQSQKSDDIVCDSPFLARVTRTEDQLLLPDAITRDILGIVNAAKRRGGINKFLFQGAPGTGKTQAAIQVARLLGRTLLEVRESSLVDSKLGQTQKNIATLFRQIAEIPNPTRVVVLFDELDALALNRTDSNDLREMGRATTEFLHGLDTLSDDVVLVATTNLFTHFDKALVRRFDYVVDFDRYTAADLEDIAEAMLDRYLAKAGLAARDVRLFRKILRQPKSLPLPGDLQNVVKTSVAFSDPENGFDYMRRLYRAFCGCDPDDPHDLKARGFTIREIGVLTGQSKSSVGRSLSAAGGGGDA